MHQFVTTLSHFFFFFGPVDLIVGSCSPLLPLLLISPHMESLCQGCGAGILLRNQDPALYCETSPDSWVKAGGIEETELTGCPTGLEKGSVEPHGVGRVALCGGVEMVQLRTLP